MPIIRHEQMIHAPINVCFDLARNVSIHTKTTSHTKEKVVGGGPKDLLEEGDTVTFEAVHFGINQRLTSKVIQMDKPNMFIDMMVKGAFHSFIHTHQFVEEEPGTLMIDIFDYTSPFGFIGIMADKLFLEKYMRKFIASRAIALKQIAETIN